jgi:hypothetical protein
MLDIQSTRNQKTNEADFPQINLHHLETMLAMCDTMCVCCMWQQYSGTQKMLSKKHVDSMSAYMKGDWKQFLQHTAHNSTNQKRKV